jgi:hypothetical protein
MTNTQTHWRPISQSAWSTTKFMFSCDWRLKLSYHLVLYSSGLLFVLKLISYKVLYDHYLLTSLLLSLWNIGPQQLSVAEVSVAFKFFIETGLLALCSNPQPGGSGLHIYIPWRRGGPVNTPRHRVPILVASYDTHGLGWDYSYSPLTTRGV